MLYTASIPSPLGELTLSSSGDVLTGLWMEGQKYFFPNSQCAVFCPQLEIFDKTASWLDAYFKGEQPEISLLPLSPAGSPFAKLIWALLRDIPYGETVSYGALAAKAALALGRERMSAQAVGSAVGHNPISIIIPCHRVIASNGSLAGYAGGIERKRFLLLHEKSTKQPL